MTTVKNILKGLAWFFGGLILLFLLLSYGKDPERITYGVTLSKYYAEELGLPWSEVFTAVLDDLGVKKLRLVAYWPALEPERGTFDFADLDWQLTQAKKHNASVVLAIGRRLPRWPECHTPRWVQDLSWDEQKAELRVYLAALVERYKEHDEIAYWQVENEPFLSVFAKEHCGELDRDFLREEVAMVKVLDPKRPVLVTDSGNLGLWSGAWRLGDAFGTSVYLYLWNPEIGEVKSFYLPSFYKVKKNIMTLAHGQKSSMLIELSLEPWLLEPTVAAPVDAQLDRMDIDKFHEVIDFARQTGFDEQYLWGAEWWYYMRGKGHPEFWEEAKDLFTDKA